MKREERTAKAGEGGGGGMEGWRDVERGGEGWRGVQRVEKRTDEKNM